MKFDPIKCPHCGEVARGSIETVTGVALFTGPDEKGEVEYAGETDIDWNTQETIIDEDADGDPVGVILSCPNGHEWTARDLTLDFPQAAFATVADPERKENAT